MSLVAVCCGKGSPGCTFVSVNLASALSDDEVLLIDLDPQGGDLVAYLGLDPGRGLHPLTQVEGSPTPQALLKEAECRGPLMCLGGFPRSDEANFDVLSEVLLAAAATGCTVIADLGRVGLSTAQLLTAADLVLLTARPDLVGVYGARRAIDNLRRFGVDARLTAVISGWERRRPADLAEATEALGIPVIGAIPLDPNEARRALNAQRPLERGPAAKAFAALASEVTGLLASRPALSGVRAR